MAEKATGKAPPKGEPPPQEELTPFERMKRLTEAVVQVPKTEAVEPDRKAKKKH